MPSAEEDTAVAAPVDFPVAAPVDFPEAAAVDFPDFCAPVMPQIGPFAVVRNCRTQPQAITQMTPKHPNVTVKCQRAMRKAGLSKAERGRRENRIAITTSLRPRAHKTGEAIWCHVLESRASRSATYFFNSTVSTLCHNIVGRAAE